MSPRNWQFRLEDIYESLLKIEEYTEGLDYTRWQHDRKTVDAVVRNLEIIGEAANNVPEEIQEQHNTIPWYQMKAMRNILIHEYFGVDMQILWKTLQEDLPLLKRALRQIMDTWCHRGPDTENE